MASTQTLTELPEIQYTGMDYDTIVSEIKTIISNHPNWSSNWDTTTESEAGLIFIELMAYLTDNLAIRQDLIFNEMFPSTAKKEKSRRRLLNEINYMPELPVAATVPVKIELSELLEENLTLMSSLGSSDSLSGRTNSIMSFSGKNINGKSTTYELLKINSDDQPDYLGSIVLEKGNTAYTADSDGDTLTVLEGETHYEEFTSSTIDGPTFTLSEEGDTIAQESIRVFVTSDSNKECLLVDNFLSTDARDVSGDYADKIPFVVQMDESGNLYIRFATEDLMTWNSTVHEAKLFPLAGTIGVFYRTTTGSLGNISAGFLNTTISSNGYSGKIYNESSGSGGEDCEELEDAILNGPLSLRHMDRAVTYDDYDNIIKNNQYILKSKTYTSYNAPSTFYNYYGRYINPQEAFSFIMLNKNYSEVPSSQYNNFSWGSLKKEPILNEKYIFDNAVYNTAVDIGSTYENYTAVTSSANKWYRNATIITLPDDFIERLQTEIGDETERTLKLKLSTTTADYSYFNEIPFNLVDDEDDDNACSMVITTDNPKVTKNVHAMWTSSDSFDKDTPINVYNYDEITFILDGKTEITVSLKEDYNSKSGATAYYLLLDNDVSDLDENDIPSNISESSESYAKYRRGIVQLINDQIANLVATSENYRMYSSTRSFQYFNLNATSNTAELSLGMDEDSERTYLAFNLNGTIYAFAIGYEVYTAAKKYYQQYADTLGENAYFYYPYEDEANGSTAYWYISGTSWVSKILDEGTALYGDDGIPLYYSKEVWSQTNSSGDSYSTSSLKTLADILQYQCIANNQYLLKYDTSTKLWERVYSEDEISDDTVIGLKNFRFECLNKIHFDSDVNDDDDSSSYSYDLVFENIRESGLVETDDGKCVSVTNSNLIAIPKTMYIGSDTTTGYMLYDFASRILGVEAENSLATYTDLIGEPQYAVSYETVASTIDDEDDSENCRLRITSPLKGYYSTLYFYLNGRSTSSSSSTADFMYNIMGLRYSAGNGYSYKAYGLRTAELYLVDATAGYIGESGSLELVEEAPVTGEVVFTDNDLSHLFTNYTIYANYKLTSNSSLEIGTRENWYSPDDEEAPSIHGIEGQSVELNSEGRYVINENLSDFDVRITSKKQDTNSLYTISTTPGTDTSNGETGFDLYPVKRIELPTNTMTISDETSNIPLSFKIDSMTDYLDIDIGTVGELYGSKVYTKIKTYMETSSNSATIVSADASDIKENIDSIIRYQFDNKNQLIFGNLLRTDDGAIYFRKPSLTNDESEISDSMVQEFFYKFLGTNKTNPELYEIWTISAMEEDNSAFEEDYNVVYLSSDKTEFYYVPTDDCPLKFKYRFLKDEETATADYYVTVSGDDTSNYTFYLNKTSNSNFPDGYFYVHFVQDRTYEQDEDDDNIVTIDEDSLQNYMSKRKITGTDITFCKPYFKTFDIVAYVVYNDNYSQSTIEEEVTEALEEEFSIDNINIATSVSRSKIFKAIMGCTGVESCEINYFGLDYSDTTTYPDCGNKITAQFYEQLCLATTTGVHGLNITYASSSEDEES